MKRHRFEGFDRKARGRSKDENRETRGRRGSRGKGPKNELMELGDER
jgi:hypothetical protein